MCQRKEQAGTWSQVAKVWVLLLQLRKKHFAHTPKQMLREQVQETGPTLLLIHAAAAFPLLGLGQLVLGQAGAWAVKCQDNWCWAVPAESVLVLEQWHQCKDDWCWDSCHQAWLDSAGTDTAIPSFSLSEGWAGIRQLGVLLTVRGSTG